jgi:hypothetical protein
MLNDPVQSQFMKRCIDGAHAWQKGKLKRAENYIIGPLGSPLTLSELPSPLTHRWVIRRKAEVVAAVNGGLLSLDDACKLYTLSADEFFGWQKAIEEFGMAGLRTRARQRRGKAR